MGATGALLAGSLLTGLITGRCRGGKPARPTPRNPITAGPKPAAAKKKQAAAPYLGTLLTGPQGLGEVPAANRESKTLLGF